MAYLVKEIFYTLQGEGGQAGRPAVFCRFAGCNLWSGLERDRAAASCAFCDTDFVGIGGEGGGKFADAAALAAVIAATWGAGVENRFVVLTGGEPLLQVDAELVGALHGAGFEIALETNGTLLAPKGIDWITVSPKGSNKLAQTSGAELKLAFPQKDVDPTAFEGLAFERFLLQPIDGPDRSINTDRAIAFCLAHPRWRLSLQTHKFLGLK